MFNFRKPCGLQAGLPLVKRNVWKVAEFSFTYLGHQMPIILTNLCKQRTRIIMVRNGTYSPSTNSHGNMKLVVLPTKLQRTLYM